jgi:hypothetical protein
MLTPSSCSEGEEKEEQKKNKNEAVVSFHIRIYSAFTIALLFHSTLQVSNRCS